MDRLYKTMIGTNVFYIKNLRLYSGKISNVFTWSDVPVLNLQTGENKRIDGDEYHKNDLAWVINDKTGAETSVRKSCIFLDEEEARQECIKLNKAEIVKAQNKIKKIENYLTKNLNDQN